MAGCSGAAPQNSEGFLLKAALLYRSFVTRKKDLELMFLLTAATARPLTKLPRVLFLC